MRKCPECHGQGAVLERESLSHLDPNNTVIQCETCDGAGQVEQQVEQDSR